MPRIVSIRSLVTIAALTMAACSLAAPLEFYGRLPSMEQVSISLDGQRIAFIRRYGANQQIEIRSVPDQAQIASFAVNDLKLRRVELVDDSHLMMITSSTTMPYGLLGAKNEWSRLKVYDIRARKWSEIPDEARIVRHSDIFEKRDPLEEISGRVLVRHVDGHTVLFFRAYYPIIRVLPALMKADLETGDEELMHVASMDGKLHAMNWAVSAGGDVIAEQDFSELSQRWSVTALVDGEWKVVVERDANTDIPMLHGFGTSASTLLMWARESERAEWKSLSLKDGGFSALYSEPESMYAPIEDRETGYVIGRIQSGDFESYEFAEPSLQSRWQAIVRSFPDDHVRLISASKGFKKAIVLIDGWNLGYQYRLVDLETGKSAFIGLVYDGIPVPLTIRRLDYPARDGLRIRAYLTVPRGRPAKTLPLVVLVHGGPAAQDTQDFDWWSQALADQGYAVLRANFRGSSVNAKVLAAGFGEFGRKMQTDLSDGVRYLAQEGVIDPERVCIVGASYGGYAALAGVTLDTGVYRCAISVAGVADPKQYLKSVNGKHLSDNNLEQRFWDRFMGVKGPTDPVLDQISPIRHVDSVTVPVLLIHGKEDTVVPYEQSDDMYDALRHAKKNVELVALKNEDHWLSRSESRLQMLQATVAFLRKHNPPD